MTTQFNPRLNSEGTENKCCADFYEDTNSGSCLRKFGF